MTNALPENDASSPEQSAGAEYRSRLLAKVEGFAVRTHLVEDVNRHSFERYMELGIAEYLGRVTPDEAEEMSRTQEYPTEENGYQLLITRPIHSEDGKTIIAYDAYHYSRAKEREHAAEVAAIRAEMEAMYAEGGEEVSRRQNEMLADEVLKGTVVDYGELTWDQYFDEAERDPSADWVTVFLYNPDGTLISGRQRMYKVPKGRTPSQELAPAT